MILVEKPFPQDFHKEPARVTAQRLYQHTVTQSTALDNRMRTPGAAKSLQELPGLLKTVIDTREDKSQIAEIEKVYFTTEEPDAEQHLETITFSVVKNVPGGYGQGSPFDQAYKNLRPFLREEQTDPDNPGYMRATFGKFYDSLIRLTCWARTSWQSEMRAAWLEETVEQYTWWLTMQGISRIYFWSRGADEMKDVKGNKIYGKPLDFYVKTEKISHVSEKTLEELVIKLGVSVA
jgi:hypothetical protein